MAIKEIKRSCIRILCDRIHHNINEWLYKLLIGLIQYVSVNSFCLRNLLFYILGENACCIIVLTSCTEIIKLYTQFVHY